jgi:hypothetical protein
MLVGLRLQPGLWFNPVRYLNCGVHSAELGEVPCCGVHIEDIGLLV